jgi:fumarate reductase subunit C
VHLTVLSTGVALWVVYGTVMRDPSVLVANILTLLAVMTLVAVKAWFGASRTGTRQERVTHNHSVESRAG